jgi:hypothetical protein
MTWTHIIVPNGRCQVGILTPIEIWQCIAWHKFQVFLADSRERSRDSKEKQYQMWVRNDEIVSILHVFKEIPPQRRQIAHILHFVSRQIISVPHES